jgi:prepilin signal peptidase PulO-like enzyme (type II secretory pathway)
MEYLPCIVLFLFGLIIGSFLNVVILRFNTGMSIAKGRSVCFSCGKTLAWYELVPLFSFLVQGGRCRGCKAKISWQYPLIELAAGLAFVLSYIVAPETFSLLAILLCLYIVIAVYDLKHKIIPDFFSYAAGLVALGMIAIDYAATGTPDFLRIVTGPLLFLFFWAVWKVSKGTWMGLGDGKLALSMGWALGFTQGVAAFLISFWMGAILSLLVIAYQRIRHGKSKLGMRSEIPFGPFLIAAFLITLLFHLDIQAILIHLAV